MKIDKNKLSSQQREDLLNALKARFEKNMNRHKGLEWAKVQSRLGGMEANPDNFLDKKLWSLNEMEISGGEPDIVAYDKNTGEYIFMIVQWKVLKAAEAFVTTTKR